MNRRTFLAAAFAIVALALALRLFHACERDSIWGDEAQELGILRSSDSVGTLLDIVRQDGHPPLHYLIEWGLYRAAGEPVVMARTHLVLYGTLAVVFVMLLAYRAFGPRCALLTGLLAATSPFFIAYSTELRNYALFSALGALFGVAYVRLLERRDLASALLWGAAGALLSLTHYYGLFLVATSGFYVVWTDRSRAGFAHVAAAAGAFVLVFAPWIPSFLWQTSVDLQGWAHPQADPRIVLLVLTGPLGRAVAIVAAASLVLGAVHVRRPGRPPHESIAFFGLVFASIGATVFAYVVQFSRGWFASRYLIAHSFVLLPAVCLYASRMGSLGDVPAWRGMKTGRTYRLSQRRHGQVGLALLIVVALGYHQAWKLWGARRVSAVARCAELIELQERPDDLIVASPAWALLEVAHHYSGSLPICAPPYGQPFPWLDHLRRLELSRDIETVQQQVAVLTDHLRGGGRVWAVVQYRLPTDPAGLERFRAAPKSASTLLRYEHRIHDAIMTALYRHGEVGFRWESRWDDFRHNAVLLRFDPRPEVD